MRRSMLPVSAALIAAVALAGCSSQTSTSNTPEPQTKLSSQEFWEPYSRSSASEVDPAESLADLTSKSTLIVRGKISGTEPGESFPTTLDDGTQDKGKTTVITLDVSETLSGKASGPVKVWVANSDPNGSEVAAERLPSNEYIWYLKPSEQPGLMYASAKVGVVGEDPSGKLVSVMSPGDTDVISGGLTNLDSLEAATEKVTAE